MPCFKKAKPWASVEKDVVVLHQFFRGKYCPSLSPFALKVECFLRLAGIKYESEFKHPFSKKGLCPWITLNNEDVADSQLAVEHLSRHFNIDLDVNLTKERKASLEAARCMAEHHLFWFLYLWRYYHCKSVPFATTQHFPTAYFKFFFVHMMPGKSYRKVKVVGPASHSKEEQHSMVLKVLQTLYDLLGDRKFFGGDQPCTSDCSLFGFIAQYVWNEPGTTHGILVKEEYPLFIRYAESMKELLYPDWESLLRA